MLKEKNGRPAFSDVGARTAYRADIQTLYQAGVIGGYEDGTFHPDDPVTRAEVCVMISNIIGQ